MSSQVNKLFRHSWLMTFAGVGVFLCVLMALSLMQLNGQEHVEPWLQFDSVRWFRGKSQSTLLALMAAATFPWLLLSLSGEWLYTRSLNRKQLFKLIWKEYLKWSAFPLILFVALTIWTQLVPYDSGSQIPWEQVGFAIGINLLVALIFASNARILKSLVPPVFLMFLGFYFLQSWRIDKLWIWTALSIGGIALIVYAYHLVASDSRDLNISRIGTEDDENQSLERLKIFQGIDRFSSLRLTSLKGISALWGRIKLVTEHSRMIYLQVLFIVLSFSLAMILLQLPARNTYMRVFPQAHLFDDLSCLPCLEHQPFLLSAALFGGIAFLLLLIPSRLLLNDRWEFLATRPQSKQFIYLANWGIQSTLVIFMALLAYSSLLWQAELAPYLNTGAILWLATLLLIGGELFAFFLIVLLTISISLTPDLLIAWLTVLHGQDWPALAFVVLAIAYRLWDAYVQTAHSADSKVPGHMFRTALWHYGPCLTFAVLITFFSVEVQPLARFIARPAITGMSPSSQEILDKQVILAIYTRLPNEIRENGELKATLQVEEIRNLIHRPYHSDDAYAFSKSFVNLEQSWKYNVTWQSYTLKHDHQALELSDSLRAAEFWLNQDSSKFLDRTIELAVHTNEKLGKYDALNKLQIALNHTQNKLLNARRDRILFRTQQALQTYLDLAQTDPKVAAQAYLQAGNLTYQSKLYDQAIRYWLEHLKLKNGNHVQEITIKDFEQLEPVVQNLLLFPYYENNLCLQQIEFSKMLKIKSAPTELFKRLKAEQALCSGRIAPQNPTTGLALWFVKHNQADQAIEVYQNLHDKIRQAQVLFEQGKTQQARLLAQVGAQKWQKFSADNVFFSHQRVNRQYLAHRLILQTLRPDEIASLDSGLHVLMGSTNPRQDQALIEAAFKFQEAERNQLREIAEHLNTLYRFYQDKGFLNAEKLRSPEQTLALISVAEIYRDRTSDPNFHAAVKALRQLML